MHRNKFLRILILTIFLNWWNSRIFRKFRTVGQEFSIYAYIAYTRCRCASNLPLCRRFISSAPLPSSSAVSNTISYTVHTHTHTHTRLTALCPGIPRWAGTRKVKPIWILQKQETVSGSGISWAICKPAPRSRQITMPAPHRSYRPDALPAAQPTASKHWRQKRQSTRTRITKFSRASCEFS